MVDQAGTTVRGYGHCPEHSEIFPVDTFNLGQSIPKRPRIAAEQIRARWFGHDLSGAQDSGIGRTEDGKTCGGRVGRFGQSTFHSTIPQPIRRKRRAGGRVVTVSGVGLDVRNEGAMWGTPRKRAFLVRKVRTAYHLFVMLRRPSRDGRRTTRIWKRPSWGGRRTTNI